MSKEKEFVDMLNKEMNELKTAHHTENLEQENEKLKQRLTEKDKEIKELKNKFIIALGDIKQYLGAHIVERNGYDMIVVDYQYIFRFIDKAGEKLKNDK